MADNEYKIENGGLLKDEGRNYENRFTVLLKPYQLQQLFY